MRIIIAPAKKMNVDVDSFPVEGLPCFLDDAEKLKTALQTMSLAGERMRGGRSLFSPDEDVIASPLVSVVNDPTPPDWSVDYRLDSEGTLCEKRFLVRDGKLETPMLTLTEAAAQSRVPTGNAGRVVSLSGTTPVGLVTVPACVYIAPGDSTVDQLLEQMGTGLYLTYSLDVFYSVNVISGQFSIPCGGILYRDGAPVGTVDQLTMAGDLRSLLAGVTCIEHGVMLTRREIDLMAQRDVPLVSTLYVSNLCASLDGPDWFREKASRCWQTNLRTIEMARKAGVRIALGTDFSNSRTTPYLKNGMEFEAMRKAGLTNLEAIRAGTLHAAQVMGREDRLGTLEAGKLADIILVDGDPLTDIGVLADACHVTAVFQGGRKVK